MKHTPGPWNALYFKSDNTYAVCMEDGGDLIADIFINGEANSRLIASAPDLLEALQNIVKVTRDIIYPNHPSKELECLYFAEEAISRATIKP